MDTEGQSPSELVVYRCLQHINNTWSSPPVLCAGKPPSPSNRRYCNFCLIHLLIKWPGNLIKISCTLGTLIMPKPKRVLKYLDEVNRRKIWKKVWQASLFCFMYYCIMCINRSTKTWRGENPKFRFNLQHCGRCGSQYRGELENCTIGCVKFDLQQERTFFFFLTHPDRLWALLACHPSVTKDSFLTEWAAETWRLSVT